LPYGPSIGDLVNWALLISDGSTIQDAGNETIVSMTSDDFEVQDDVKKIINKIFEFNKGKSFEINPELESKVTRDERELI